MQNTNEQANQSEETGTIPVLAEVSPATQSTSTPSGIEVPAENSKIEEVPAGSETTFQDEANSDNASDPASVPEPDLLSPSVNDDGDTVVQTVPVNLLSSHPKQVEIYGELKIDDPIFESVRANGVRHPVTVNERGQILNGNRRTEAAKTEGLAQIPVIVVPNRTETEELEYLIESNLNRVKTNEQEAREAAMLMKIETQKAAARQAEAARAKKGKNVPVKSPEAKANGEARVIVGKKLGMGGTKAGQCERVIEMLDKLKGEGKTEAVEELLGLLNKSVNQAAKNLVKFTVSPCPVDPTAAVEESGEPAKGDIIADLWDCLSLDIHHWSSEKILSFKDAVLEFRTEWQEQYELEAATPESSEKEAA